MAELDTTVSTVNLHPKRHVGTKSGARLTREKDGPMFNIGRPVSVGAAEDEHKLTVGVLALQGSFAEHVELLHRCSVHTRLVRRASELDGLDGLIIPGGESTTIAKLTGNTTDPIFDEIIRRAEEGMPVYGTCMGMIFLAREIEGSSQGRLALMDIKVRRNAFGPQIASREQMVAIPELGDEPVHLVFIRGPIILECSPHVEILARVEEGIVMCRQDNLLATAFHPELTADLRVHEYFVDMVRGYVSSRSA